MAYELKSRLMCFVIASLYKKFITKIRDETQRKFYPQRNIKINQYSEELRI